jgi:HEPN domain-containing protein
MTDAVWRLVVARAIDNAALEALAREGATYVSGHSSPGHTSSSLLVRAEDEAAARSAIERALGEQAFIREARAMPVFVHAPIVPDARSAFEMAAGEETRVGGVVEDETTGGLEVYFELPPGDVDRVFNEARGLYERIANSAGVPVPDPLEMSMSGFEAMMVQASRDRQLLDRARNLVEHGEHELGVILAQTACEVLVADALRSLLHPHVSDQLRPWLLGRVKSFALVDDPTRDLWNGLTGSAIQEQEFWTAYRMHVKRRHGIVHSGDRVDDEAARSSLDAALALFNYVERVIGAAPPPTSSF